MKFVICENISLKAFDVLKQFDVAIFSRTFLIKNATFIENKFNNKGV